MKHQNNITIEAGEIIWATNSAQNIFQEEVQPYTRATANEREQNVGYGVSQP